MKTKITLGFLLLICMFQINMMGQNLKIEMPNYTLQSTGTDAEGIMVKNKNAENLLKLGLLSLRWTPGVHPTSCTYELVTEDGFQAIRANYNFPNDVPGSITMTGTFIARPNRIDIRYNVVGVPNGYVGDWGGSMFLFILQNRPQTEILPPTNIGIWKRNANGGLPVEVIDSKVSPFRINDDLLCLVYGPENHANLDWKDDWYRHTGLIDNHDGSYSAQVTILLTDAEWPLEAVSSVFHNRSFALTLKTDKTYNWWSDKSEPLTVDASIINISQETKEVNLKSQVYDFDGNLIVDRSENISISAVSGIDYPISFTPAEEQGIFFVEVSLEDENGTELLFSRTNVSLLPDHAFSSSAAGSNLMGLSAYWPYPNETELQRLLERMGVRWLRNGNTNDFNNIQAMYHNNIDWNRTWSNEERNSLIRDCFQTMVANNNKIWEFGNELNMTGGIESAALAVPYVEWLNAIKQIQGENPAWADIKIISFGLAGTDEAFLDKIAELGGWNLLDGIALHPGRGNFTADYPVNEPWGNWTKPSSGYAYWNFYGSVRHAKNIIKRYGDKELYLTEIYACDFPNNSWYDTPRNSADNVVLSYALAAAEGVKNALYYQLFNSVWWDQLGINPDDAEYFFGMINRDLSFKPSLMAFCAISEALDDATFKGWIRFLDEKNKNTKGMLFETPNSHIAILWDRTDGYILTDSSPDFISPEPWINTWTSHTEVTLPYANDLVLVNSIGKKETVQGQNSSATIQLDGSPVIAYGVDPSQIQLYNSGTSINTPLGKNEIRLYPNLLKEGFWLEGTSLENGNKLNISIYNVSGQLVKSEEIPLSDTNVAKYIDMTNLSSGIYFVNLNSKSYKIVKL
jgi:hypothetical protein